MLDPDYLEEAGALVAAVYSQIEAEMCLDLTEAMLEGDLSTWRAQLALRTLGQGESVRLRAILERHRGEVSRAVAKEVEDAIRRSDAADLAAVKAALGVELPEVTSYQVASVVRTVTEMLERDNLAMLSGAKQAFLRESTWAVTEVETGDMGMPEALRRATRRLSARGIDVIQYKDPTTGDLTATSKADVAVRRHVRSQLSQACATRSLQICDESGCGFVEVSSHVGARPSHQDWEGRCYSLHGEVTVDGVTYRDFWEATGYGGVEGDHAALGDRLCGVNCRHQFGPWMPGMPHAYEPSPRHPSGKSSKEVYELSQKQRGLERALRDAKRTYQAARKAYEIQRTPESLTDAQKAKAQMKARQQKLLDFIDEHGAVLSRDVSREWAGDMPRTRLKGT